MKKVILLFFAVVGVLQVRAGYAAQDLGYAGTLKLIISNIPTFEEFSVPLSDDVKIAEDIDWDSDPDAWSFRTRLRAGLKSGPNFADKYAVVTFGCGTQCQVNRVVNVETGKVLGGFTSTYGANYKRNSRLIIRNDPDYDALPPEAYELLGAIEYYAVLDDELVLMKRLDIKSLYVDVDEAEKR